MSNTTSPSILIIDDKHLIRDIYTHAFSRAGYTITAAATGREALGHIDTSQFDIILLDIMMPDMDGLTLLDTLSEHPNAAAQGPVVLLSNLNIEDVEKLTAQFPDSKRIRIAGHIVKSDLTPEEIIKRVDALVSTRD